MEYTIFDLVTELQDELDLERCEAIEILRESEKSDDFEWAGFRVIKSDHIDEIMQQELGDDEYLLGCFSSWLIADVLDVDCDAIERIQKTGEYSALGAMINSKSGALEELQKQYAALDGYGHHFNSYDGSEVEINNYYFFNL